MMSSGQILESWVPVFEIVDLENLSWNNVNQMPTMGYKILNTDGIEIEAQGKVR